MEQESLRVNNKKENAKILDLFDVNSDFFGTGGKASNLNKLARLGFNVPRGFVVCNVSLEKDLDMAASYYLESGLKNVAVRSSASCEDGDEFSSAGQYSTVLNVEGESKLREAVKKCVESLNSDTALSYSSQFVEAKSINMNVVVQSMVDAKISGVCFSKSPSLDNHILIEIVEGIGEKLVSGTARAYQINVNRDDLSQIETDCDILSKASIEDLCKKVLEMEEKFGFALDTEFAFDKNNELFWLQARPITVRDEVSIDELDARYDMDGMTITRCNIGEMLPGAVTPLTISTNLYAIDYGMRVMLQQAGIVKKVEDLPDYACALSINNHLFLNLSPIYKMEAMVLGAKKETIELSICGRKLDTPFSFDAKVGFFRKLRNGKGYFSFMLSKNKARKELSQIADTLKIGEDVKDAEGLFRAIDVLKERNDRAMTLHYVTSSHSGAMSSAMLMVLKKKMDTDEAKNIVAMLLEGIDGIESVDILRSLKKLASEAKQENPSVIAYSESELKEYLQRAGEGVKLAHKAFLEKHGHRAIREAEMRSKGWADDEEAFLSYLKTVIMSGEDRDVKSTPPNIKAVIKNSGLRGFKAWILGVLTKQARAGVVNREFSKSKIIKVMDVFKKAYSRLANMLFEAGVLPETDLIYFLTHEEIGQLVLNKRFSLIKKAIKRRRLLDEQSLCVFDEVNVGKPKPIISTVELGEDVNILKGLSISRGLVTAKARVVKSEADARLLQKGEIMVASYTDIGWSPYYCLVSGLVTEVGSVLSHGAVVAREYSLPLVSNVNNATRIIKTGDTITLDGYKGEVIIGKP